MLKPLNRPGRAQTVLPQELHVGHGAVGVLPLARAVGVHARQVLVAGGAVVVGVGEALGVADQRGDAVVVVLRSGNTSADAPMPLKGLGCQVSKSASSGARPRPAAPAPRC